MSYLVGGDENAPSMVLLHALGEQASAWEPVFSRFAATHRVYAPDLRGHGQSDWPGGYAFETYVDDLMGFLDALDLDPIVLVGHSMGAPAGIRRVTSCGR